MAKNTKIKKVLIIGSGPIIVGQACEFDYSGTQACKALKELGYEIILVNSNPATIMTDPKMADKTYIEPLTPEYLERIIEKERPDALLPNLGGQTGLNLSSELYKKGILDKYNVQLIGVKAEAIEKGEDRIGFKNAMNELNIPMPKSKPIYSVEEAEKSVAEFGYPVVLRPAFTLGGTGGGIAYNLDELRTIVNRGLTASLIHQVLMEESVLGWEELELEVVRDNLGKKITVCFIENVDPMGIHTGDSFCVAPMLTVKKETQNKLQEMSYRIVDSIGVVGGCNVQFAHNPENGRIVIIEINPRTSRSSALASKATGFPIALISAKLAAGLNLADLPYWKEGTLDKYQPSGDYVVVKFARWAFEKFPSIEDKLGTQMQSVGEVMSIGKNFKEALLKAIRSLEINRYGLGLKHLTPAMTVNELKTKLAFPSSQRIFYMYEALRMGISIDELYQLTKIHRWFIGQMKELVELEESILKFQGKKLPDPLLTEAKKAGFSDKYLAQLLKTKESELYQQRQQLKLIESYELVPVSGASAAYYYSTFNAPDSVPASKNRKILILGGGPNRIGQGIEFDYTCVHAAFTLKEEGIESIMINCNPETVSTDYDTADKLYFEPLTVENVLSIYAKEQPEGVIVQFGGQTPLNIATELKANGINILGTTPESIHLAEDRQKFRTIIERLKIPQPDSDTATSVDAALKVAKKIGYPLMVRPSFVLGGRGMQIVYDETNLINYITNAIKVNPEYPILIDKFLENAIEIEVDAICDGTDVYIPAIMEHIELAGIHSGDSACVIPSRNISPKNIKVIEDYTKKIALELNVVGLLNIQYAMANDTIYILEANPRASRTVPFVSKVLDIPMARITTQVILGKKLKNIDCPKKKVTHFGVKEAVFSFSMFPGVDPILGPEMRATGEVMGLDKSFGAAYHKAQIATGTKIKANGNVLISVSDNDKSEILTIAKKLKKLDFNILATSGTHQFLTENSIKADKILKLHEGRPNITDEIHNNNIQMIINTPVGAWSKTDDSYIRKAAIQYKIPYMTTMAAAHAAVDGLIETANKPLNIMALQELFTH